MCGAVRKTRTSAASRTADARVKGLGRLWMVGEGRDGYLRWRGWGREQHLIKNPNEESLRELTTNSTNS